MRVRELRILLILAEELHFGRASERLGMAQPQLSETVRRIEAEAGVSIFTRRPRVRVTHAGEVMIATARRVLADLDAGIGEAKAVSAGRVGKVTLGFSSLAMCTELPAALRRFVGENPMVELKLVEGTTGPLRAQLEQGALDFAVTREAIVTEGVESVRYAQDRTNVVLPTSHWAAEKQSIRLSELSGEDFIFFPRSMAPRYYDRIMRWCREGGLEPRIVRENESWVASFAFVGGGMGVTFATELHSNIGFPGVTYKSLAGQALDVSFWLNWLPARLSPVAMNLLGRILPS